MDKKTKVQSAQNSNFFVKKIEHLKKYLEVHQDQFIA